MAHYRKAFLVICLAAAFFACKGTNQTSSNEPSLPATEEAQPPKAEPPPAPLPEPNEEAAYEPVSFGDRILIEPETPSQSETVKVRAGPLTFRNGCEGIERSWAEGPDERGVIELRWSPRPIPPDAMCTMALHSQWIEVDLEGLEAGDYMVIAPGIGEQSFSVLETSH